MKPPAFSVFVCSIVKMLSKFSISQMKTVIISVGCLRLANKIRFQHTGNNMHLAIFMWLCVKIPMLIRDKEIIFRRFLHLLPFYADRLWEILSTVKQRDYKSFYSSKLNGDNQLLPVQMDF